MPLLFHLSPTASLLPFLCHHIFRPGDSRNPQGHMLCIISGLHCLESSLTEWYQKISIPRDVMIGNSLKKKVQERKNSCQIICSLLCLCPFPILPTWITGIAQGECRWASICRRWQTNQVGSGKIMVFQYAPQMHQIFTHFRNTAVKEHAEIESGHEIFCLNQNHCLTGWITEIEKRWLI